MRTTVAVLGMVALAALSYVAMWRGWRHRGERQADVPALHRVAGDPATVLRQADGRYFATTTAGQWMERVVVHGLGVRSPCTLRLTPDGLDVLRGDLSFTVPRADLVGARRDRGVAGKVLPPHGVLVVTWRRGQHTLDSGFRLARAAEHDAWVSAVTELAQEVPR